MPRGKPTIARDSVFRSTRAQAKPPAQGTPADAQRRQTALWLGDDESEWIDEQCKAIHRGGWRGITRSAYIRALIQADKHKPADLSGVSGEQELAERLAGKR